MKANFKKLRIYPAKRQLRCSIAILFLAFGISNAATGQILQMPISNCAELQAVANDLAGSYYLTQDIDCSGMKGFKPVGSLGQPFNGIVDGKNHVVRGLTIRSDGDDFAALFGRIGKNGRIRNLNLEDINIKGEGAAGGLVAINEGQITGCSVAGKVKGGNFVGGLAGANSQNGKIEFSHSTGSVEGNLAVGGLVGINRAKCEILYCSSTGKVTGYFGIGGLVGSNEENALIEFCYTAGSVEGDIDVGGLVGKNEGLIRNSYAVGQVIKKEGSYIGGLVGSHTKGRIEKCYAAGEVSGNTSVGGFSGKYEGIVFMIRQSYWNVETTGQAKHAGEGGLPVTLWPLTSPPMRQSDSFKGWDFDNVWRISDQPGGSFPYLIRNPQVPPPGSTEK